jgi:hypothetical protein
MPDKKNRTPTQDIIITDKALESFKTFATIADIRTLSRGLRVIFNAGLADGIAEEEWFKDFLNELKILNDFIDEVEDEYGPPI